MCTPREGRKQAGDGADDIHHESYAAGHHKMKINASVPPHNTEQTHELNKTCGTESMTLIFTKNITEKSKMLTHNEHFRAMITARLRNRSVAHGGFIAAADNDRGYATHRYATQCIARKY